MIAPAHSIDLNLGRSGVGPAEHLNHERSRQRMHHLLYALLERHRIHRPHVDILQLMSKFAELPGRLVQGRLEGDEARRFAAYILSR